jgi:ketosteroid isomerase-like protein
MRIYLLLFWICLLGTTGPVLSSEPTSADERTLWDLERAYWRNVENNDLAAYSDLFHKDFVGWPVITSAPVHKDGHLTDWITAQTSKGLAFKTVEFKPADIHIIGDVAVAYYWITFQWMDKNGNGAPVTLRITHTWLRSGKDWRIIGGMSMLQPETPAK